MDAAAGVLAATGAQVLIAVRWSLPTPLNGLAVRALDADAGVMITACTTRPPDNGYKVFWAAAPPTRTAAVQIVPPADAEIAARIAASPPGRRRGAAVDAGHRADRRRRRARLRRPRRLASHEPRALRHP